MFGGIWFCWDGEYAYGLHIANEGWLGLITER